MKLFTQDQILRFQEEFPEFPRDIYEVVMLYAVCGQQVEIFGANGQPTRRQVEWKLNKAANILELNSLQALRMVVLTRLLLSRN